MTKEDLDFILKTFPGVTPPPSHLDEYLTWKGRMALWAYQYGPTLLSMAKQFVEIQEYLRRMDATTNTRSQATEQG